MTFKNRPYISLSEVGELARTHNADGAIVFLFDENKKLVAATSSATDDDLGSRAARFTLQVLDMITNAETPHFTTIEESYQTYDEKFEFATPDEVH